ncbi:hypothetical protein [Streptomyces virginiae]|uniref:hypothetical protein n=1 Tax=Streptomyces virginiae TaxID=1961 RepID=UPI003651866B
MNTVKTPRTIPPRVRFVPGEQPAGDELLLLALCGRSRERPTRRDVVYSSRRRMNG